MIIEILFAYLLRTLYIQFRQTHASEQELTRQSTELGLANLRFNTVLSHMSHALSMFDADERLVIHNLQFEKLWGLTEQDLKPGAHLKELLDRRERLGFYEPGQAQKVYETHTAMRAKRYSLTHKLADGRSILLTFDPMPGGGWVAIHEDITERERAAARITHLAHHDGLTGLANRSLFVGTLEKQIARGDLSFAVMLVDLDRFKEVNDTFGHGIGDKLLRIVARRLLSAVRSDDLVSRLGGD